MEILCVNNEHVVDGHVVDEHVVDGHIVDEHVVDEHVSMNMSCCYNYSFCSGGSSMQCVMEEENI